MEMRKYGFRIQTRGGSVVDNLVILARDAEEAERKLRQVYHHCTVLERHTLAQPAPSDSSDLEVVIDLIASESAKDPPDGSES